MLPTTHRLHKQTEIKSLIQTGQTFFLPEFIFKFAKNQEPATKIGFVVSTKVDKSAVTRNKLQRQMREAINSFLDDIKPGFSVLIIAKKKALDLDFATIVKQFKFAATKIKIYEGK
jgi:ribonuclease P protein component